VENRSAQLPATTSDEQALCKACGLCCKGVWFSHVTIENDDVERAREVGLGVEIGGDGTAYFQQPCQLHKEGQCSAYDRWRPHACVTYRCALLDRVRDGEVSSVTAMKHILAAREIADRLGPDITAAKGGLRGADFSLRLAPEAASAPAAKDGAAPDILLPAQKFDVAVLLVYYERHFKVARPS
jgi:Putative zinc- or iron-chelating domain